MKKILVTLMTVLALMAFTACESKDVEKSEETTASVAEVTTAATEAETTSEAETTTEAETEAEVVEDTEIFVGRGYTLLIDGEKWLDGEEYMDLISKMAENTEAAQFAGLSAEEMKNMSDALFFHADNSSNFNITVTDVGNVGELSDDMLNQLAELMVEQYASMPGYTFEKYDIVEVNGYTALKFMITSENGVNTLRMNSYIFYKGTKQVVITYTVAASKFDDTIAEFEKVINTIELTDAASDDSDKPESTGSTGTADANSYSSNGFNFEYDSSKWAQKETDSEIFNYIASDDILKQATNFNIKQDDMGMDMDMSAEMMEFFALSVKEEYDTTDGVTFVDWSAYSKKDDVLLINCEAEYMGLKMKVQQYCFLKAGKLTIITFTAYDDCFDAMVPEFEAIVNSAYYE